MQRFTDHPEMTNGDLFLTSADSYYVIDADIAVDGGWAQV